MHYPSHLRDRFCQWVEEGMPEAATVEINYEVREEPARDFAFRFLGCTDLMPRIAREQVAEILDVVAGEDEHGESWDGTYHAAALAWLHREGNMAPEELAYEAFTRLSPSASRDTEVVAGDEGVPVPPLLDLHYQALRDTRQSYVDRLSSLTSLRANANSFESVLVMFASMAGATPGEIGLHLGISEAEVRARFPNLPATTTT
jgi:hypothetical protein